MDFFMAHGVFLERKWSIKKLLFSQSAGSLKFG